MKRLRFLFLLLLCMLFCANFSSACNYGNFSFAATPCYSAPTTALLVPIPVQTAAFINDPQPQAALAPAPVAAPTTASVNLFLATATPSYATSYAAPTLFFANNHGYANRFLSTGGYGNFANFAQISHGHQFANFHTGRSFSSFNAAANTGAFASASFNAGASSGRSSNARPQAFAQSAGGGVAQVNITNNNVQRRGLFPLLRRR